MKTKMIQRAIIGMLMLNLCIACSSNQKQENIDFWTATIAALETKIENNTYNEGNWQIGVEDLSRSDDASHRSTAIRYINEDKNMTFTTIFALQNKNAKKTIGYHYKIQNVKDEEEIVQNVDIVSMDDIYSKYSVTYTKQRFLNGNYQDGEEAKGEILVQGDTLTFENVPLLKETLDANKALLDQFQDTFHIDYTAYEFVNLPLLSQNADISKITDIEPEVSTTKDYYGEPRINAKGYSLVTALKVDEAYTSVMYSQYVIEQKAYTFQNTIPLEKRSEDIYQLVQNDPDTPSVVYFVDDNAYIYADTMRDEDIKQDVMNQNASKALHVLKTSNQKYP